MSSQTGSQRCHRYAYVTSWPAKPEGVAVSVAPLRVTVTVPADGGSLSVTIVFGPKTVLTLPAASSSLALTVWAPSRTLAVDQVSSTGAVRAHGCTEPYPRGSPGSGAQSALVSSGRERAV